MSTRNLLSLLPFVWYLKWRGQKGTRYWVILTALGDERVFSAQNSKSWKFNIAELNKRAEQGVPLWLFSSTQQQQEASVFFLHSQTLNPENPFFFSSVCVLDKPCVTSCSCCGVLSWYSQGSLHKKLAYMSVLQRNENSKHSHLWIQYCYVMFKAWSDFLQEVSATGDQLNRQYHCTIVGNIWDNVSIQLNKGPVILKDFNTKI